MTAKFATPCTETKLPEPPSYNIATSLPSYEEAEESKKREEEEEEARRKEEAQNGVGTPSSNKQL